MTLDQSFTARQLPWMKIGTIIDDPSVTSEQAAALGGIDFDVELRQSAYWRPDVITVNDEGVEEIIEPGHWVEEPSRLAVVRPADADEAHDTWFSYVSNDYRVVQYRDAFSFMDNINPNYVAAGSLSNGRKGFMIVQLPDHLRSDITINGIDDPHDMYVVLQTSHDLSKGATISVMMLRNKCMNMLTLPTFAADAPQSWSIRHVGDPQAKLNEAHKTLVRASRYQEIFERQVTQLASVRITGDDMQHIARRILPDRPKREVQVDAILERFQSAPTVGFAETGWGAVNAVSDYFQWGRTNATRTEQSEFTSGLDGDTAKFVNKTAQLVMTRA